MTNVFVTHGRGCTLIIPDVAEKRKEDTRWISSQEAVGSSKCSALGIRSRRRRCFHMWQAASLVGSCCSCRTGQTCRLHRRKASMAATAPMHLVTCSGQVRPGVAGLAVRRGLPCMVPSKARTKKDAVGEDGSGRRKACLEKLLLSQQSRSWMEVASSMVACCLVERRGSRWGLASHSVPRSGLETAWEGEYRACYSCA